MIDKGGEFAHGMTYSGHPVACAVAVENINIMERENLVDRVRDELSGYFADALASLNDLPLVGETRALGLLGAIELVKDKATRTKFDPTGTVGGACRDAAFEAGLVMRACGDTMVLSPPFVITRQQIDELVDMVRQAVEQTTRGIAA